MNMDDLPTNDAWTDWDWPHLFGGEDYSGTFAAGDLTGKRLADLPVEDVTEIAAWHAESPEGYGSVDFWAIAKLADGRYAVSEAWADTTGWGCRADAWWKIGPDLASVLAELSPGNRDDARAILGLPAAEATR